MSDGARQRAERLIAQKRQIAAANESAQGGGGRGTDVVAERQKRAPLKADEVAALVEALRKRPS
jgi:hypothetical protein